MSEPNKNDKPALIIAAKEGDVEGVKALIVAGADVNAKDNRGQTALIWACGQRKVDCVKALIAAGANVNDAERQGWTALMMAASNGDLDSVKALVAAGADLNAKNGIGDTALSLAKKEDVAAVLGGKPIEAKRLNEVICVSGPQYSKIILMFTDGTQETAGPHTKVAFGYLGDGPTRFSSYLKEEGFVFTDASRFQSPHRYRADGSQMPGEIVGAEIRWQDGTTTTIPPFPY